MKCVLDRETLEKTGEVCLLIYKREGAATLVGQMNWVLKPEGAAIPGPTLTMDEEMFCELHAGMADAFGQILGHQTEQGRQHLQSADGFRKDKLGDCDVCKEFWPVMITMDGVFCHKCFAVRS